MSRHVDEIARSLRLSQRRNGFFGNCPACGYSDAFSLTEGEEGKPLVYCHAGCQFSDLARSLDLGQCDLPAIDRVPKASYRVETARRRVAFVRSLIDQSESAGGTLAERYLANRGISINIPPDLRFLPGHCHRPTGQTLPVMLGIVRKVDGVEIGVHRTFLDPSGIGKASVKPDKMTLGDIKGGAVRLHPAVTDLATIAVTEGIETGLSVGQAHSLPVWAALSAGGIDRLVLPPLPAAAGVLIFADNDSHGVGQKAAASAADRFIGEGRSVRILTPRSVGRDFNDILCGRL